ncbi:MAG: DNA topoisomerase VI subunit B [Candidatus Aenigmatarchaeota archaeon]|nr:MAG: DNA topoisomerase VI subunit B [Candidatus Aenigmarchaeota archaeon]RLJ08715.1 MAG: DNA topoisomerase VI subunit B [Candidatus Aenigmarchaeota archaeon]RLJ09007.1 MAG: DNA topoisomerase VI subunit B [Candidatus Aenigmarchaeota archaeon]
MNNHKTAEELAKQHREISISQFFEKNRHLLGYDNKIKALLTIVKEAVDNALDATEDARILPEIYVKIEELSREKYKIIIKDNGPGIVKKQVSKIFGKLLYGSKFHRLKQSRGQQGIGISGCVLYSQLTTGEPTEIVSSTGEGKVHKYILKIDVDRNEPKIISEETFDNYDKWHGVQITFIAEGIYREHKQSVLEYLKETAISNPHAHIIFDSPHGRIEFHRGTDKLPPEPKEIKPHLYGVEVGILERMLQETRARALASFFVTEFSRVGKQTAEEICNKAGVDPKISPRKVEHHQVVELIEAIKETKLTRPPTDCLSPLGEELIINGLKKELNPEWAAAVSRSPTVYRGWPFQIEVGIAYGGSITEPKLMRFANRVPLLYQQGDCAITKAVTGIDWKRYGIHATQLPDEPVVIFVHMASVWVPFTSESKEAIANYPIIIKEIKLALQDCARKLSIYLSGIRKAQRIAEKKMIYERYAPDTAYALCELTNEKKEEIEKMILKLVEMRWGETEAGPQTEQPEIQEKEAENNGNREEA